MNNEDYIPTYYDDECYSQDTQYLPQESRTDKLVRTTNAATNLVMGVAGVMEASSGLLNTLSDWKRVDAECKYFRVQAGVVTHKMDLDHEEAMAVLNRSMDSRDRIIDADIDALKDGIQKGDSQQIIMAMAMMNSALDKSPVDELNKLKKISIKDDPLLDW